MHSLSWANSKTHSTPNPRIEPPIRSRVVLGLVTLHLTADSVAENDSDDNESEEGQCDRDK